MLKNELQSVSSLVSELAIICKDVHCDAFVPIDTAGPAKVKDYCLEIRKEFTEVIFSEVPDHSLRRYFNFHLKGIANIADTLFNSNCGRYNQQVIADVAGELLSLIDFVQENCAVHLNQALYAPVYFQQRLNSSTDKKAQLIISCISGSTIDSVLKNSIITYLHEMSKAGLKQFSYGNLHYYQGFVNDLSALCTGSSIKVKEIQDQLTKINFNHLQFLLYLQKSIRKKIILLSTAKQKLEFLREEQHAIDYLHYDDAPNCFCQWPSLKTMVGKWLSEEMEFFEKQVIQEASNKVIPKIEKICLNLPVAYIACIIRLFHEEKIFGTTSLSEVFRFVAQNYSSKKQPAISVGGLSKEYYGINQITAARVQELLKRMLQHLNHNFFPLLVVVSSIGYALKEIQ